MVFQITQEDIDRSSTLEQEDLGKWCFVLNGCISGFSSTPEEAEDKLTNILREDA